MNKKDLTEQIVAEIESNLQYGIGEDNLKFDTETRDNVSGLNDTVIYADCYREGCEGKYSIQVLKIED